MESLCRWKQKHSDLVPLAAAQLRKHRLEHDLTRKVKYGNESAQISRFAIDEDYMGWMLQKADGRLLYLRYCPGGPGLRFQAWLGQDCGFASDFIVHFPTEVPSTPKSKVKLTSSTPLPALSTLPDRFSSKMELRSRPRPNYSDFVGNMLDKEVFISVEQTRETSPSGSLEDDPRNEEKGDIDASLLTQRLGKQYSSVLSVDSKPQQQLVFRIPLPIICQNMLRAMPIGKSELGLHCH